MVATARGRQVEREAIHRMMTLRTLLPWLLLLAVSWSGATSQTAPAAHKHPAAHHHTAHAATHARVQTGLLTRSPYQIPPETAQRQEHRPQPETPAGLCRLLAAAAYGPGTRDHAVAGSLRWGRRLCPRAHRRSSLRRLPGPPASLPVATIAIPTQPPASRKQML